MRNTLICTVGTSLFESNLKNLSEHTPDRPENWKEIKKNFDCKNWQGLCNELLKVEPFKRICGAEINTIEEIRKKSWLQLENLILLVSDTETGRNTGSFLKKYYEQRKDMDLKQVEFKEIKQLQEAEPKKFKTHGLRNLVRAIGEYIQRFSIDAVAIDATGGYKAQIAVAVLIGQALSLPVYYKHERFNEIIEFPSLPISPDFDILGRNSDILTDFERGKSYTESELVEIDEKLRVFLSEVQVDNETLFELNAIGQIYLTSFRLRYPKPVDLNNLKDNQRVEPTFRDDNYPDGFKDFVNKVWRENRWIKTCRSLTYHGQSSIHGIGFKVRNEDDKHILIGTYEDRNNFKARFRVILPDERIENLNWAADILNKKYRN